MFTRVFTELQDVKFQQISVTFYRPVTEKDLCWPSPSQLCIVLYCIASFLYAIIPLLAWYW